MAARDTRRLTRLQLAPAVIVVVVLFGGAVAGAVRTSLAPLGGSVSLDAWEQVVRDPAFADSVAFTLWVTLAATLISMGLAVVVAGLLRHRAGVVRALVMLPVPVPHLIVATVAVLWLGPGGLAERIVGQLPAELIRDDWGFGVILVYVYKETPFLLLLLLAAMGRSLQAREEAAAVHGAGWWQRVRWVQWPAIRAPLVVGAIVVAAFVLGAFEVPLAVGPNYPPMLATYAFEATQGDVITGQGAAAATLVMTSIAAIVLAALAVRLARTAEGD